MMNKKRGKTKKGGSVNIRGMQGGGEVGNST